MSFCFIEHAVQNSNTLKHLAKLRNTCIWIMNIIFKAKLQSQKLIMNCIRGLNGFHPATTIFPKNCSYRLVYPQQEILKPQICCHQFDSLFNQADLPISGHISLPKKHLEAHSTLYQNRTRLTGIMESSVYKD